MTVPLIKAEGPGEGARPFAAEALLRIGMPQLGFHGLSENWLLKELGDRHWMMIAEMAGLDRPRFRDREGQTVYAAFCGVSVAEARFGDVGENDDLLIRSAMARVSATQIASRHRLLCRGAPVGRVELSSVFVRRERPGRNRSIARVAVEGLPREWATPGFAAITELSREIRSGVRDAHRGFRLDAFRADCRFALDLCPSLDFNGAGFLYFAAMQAMVDRAENRCRGHVSASISDREMIFHGNVDAEEKMSIALSISERSPHYTVHWAKLFAGERLIADVFSRRRLDERFARDP